MIALAPAALATAAASACAARAASPRPPSRASAAAPPGPAGASLPSDRGAVVHLLNRFAFGPRPGEIERVARAGLDAWLEAQLAPAARVPDPAGEAAVAPFAVALRTPSELYAEFEDRDVPPEPPAAGTAVPGAEPSAGPDGGGAMAPDGGAPGAAASAQRRAMAREAEVQELIAAVQMAALARHIASERQLHEVLTDFWTNHFNVFARKGPTAWLVGDFVERAIRPHALGRFEDLLVATARHPAMLVYLDNWISRAPSPARGGRPARGLNENYARELLELHTLGVDGGYTQADVVAVARILTGWTVSPPDEGRFVFEFRAGMHDDGDKTVLGTAFPAGRGEDEGRALLRLLARHPSTARFLARKLVERFVADAPPPPRLVAAVAEAYRATDGEIAAMVRTIARAPEFWAPAARRAKVKSPLEYVASAVRAVGGRAAASPGLARAVARLGQPLFLNPVPTGYPESSASWVNSAAALDRMNFALALARGGFDGAVIDLDGYFPREAAGDALAAQVEAVVLQGEASERTRAVLRASVAGLPPRAARPLAVALALASPEFLRQ